MSGSDVAAHSMSSEMDMDEAVPGPDFSDNPVCSGDGKMCGECGKIFSHPFYFSTHISIHASEKNFAVVGQCALCGLTFADAAIFSQHLNSSQNRMAVQVPEEEEDSRDQNNYSDQYDTSQNLEDYNQNGVGMSNESMARTSGENKNNVSAESLHRDHSGGSDFEPKAKRRRKMPERYDPDAISEPPRLHPDEDPAVEAYLMSLTEMGLTVDPAAFASHGKGRSRKSFGPSKGKWKGKRFPSHDPLSGDFFPPRKPSPKYEYVDYDVLLEDDMEILPKSGKQTRGLRLQQRHERLSGEPGGAAQNDTLVKTEEPSTESSSSVRASTASSSSHPDPVPSTSAGDKMPSRGFALDKLSVKTELIDKDYNPRGGTHTKPKPKAPPQPPKQVPNSQPSPSASAEPPPAPRPGLTGYARANPAFRPANSVNPALHANIKRPGTLANPQRMRNPASLASPSPKAAKSKGIERFKQESREYVEIMLQSLTSELIPTKMGKNPVATRTIYGRPADGHAANFPGYQPRFSGSRGSSGGPRHNVGRGRADTLFFKGGQLRYQPRPGLMNPPFNEVQGLWSGSSNGTTLHGQSSRWNSNPPVSQRGGAANTSQRGRGGNIMPVGRGGVAMNARGGGAPRKIVPVGGPVTHASLAGQPRPNPIPGAVFPVQMSRGGSVVGRGAGQAKAATPAVAKTPQPFLNTNEVIVVDDDDEDVNKVSKKSVEVPPEGSEKSVKKSAVIVDIDKAENPVPDIAVIRDKNKDLESLGDAEVSKDKKLSLTPAVCLTRIDEVKGEPTQNSPDSKEKTKTQAENSAVGQNPLLEVEDIEGWKVCLAANSESEASEDENSGSKVDENKSNNDADDKVSDLKDEDASKNLDTVHKDGQKEDTSDGDSIAVATAPSVPLTFPNFIGDTDNLLDIFSEIEKTCKEIEENSGNEKEDSGTESDAKEMKPMPEYEKPVADPQGEDSWTEPEGEEEEEGNQKEMDHKISDILKSLEGGEAKEEDDKIPVQVKPVKENVDGVEGEIMFRDEIENILKSIGETGGAALSGSVGGAGNEVNNSTVKDNNEKVEDEKEENNEESDVIDAKSPYNKKPAKEENGNESEGYENGGDTTMETDEDESEKHSDSNQQTSVKSGEVSPEDTVKCGKDEQSGLTGQELSESYEAGEPGPGADLPHHDGQDVREMDREVMDVDEPNAESKQHDEESDAGEEDKDDEEHAGEEEKNELVKSVCQDEEVTDAGEEVPVEVEKADLHDNTETNNVQDTLVEVAPAEEIREEKADKKKSPSRTSCKDSEDLPGDPRDDGGDEDDKQWRQRMEPSPPSAASHSFSFTALTSTSTDGTSTSGNSQPSDGTQCADDVTSTSTDGTSTSGNSQPSDGTQCADDIIAGSGCLTESATINLNTLLSDLQLTQNPSLFGKASHCDVDHAWTNHNKSFQASRGETLSQHTDWKQIPEQIPSSFSPARVSCVSCHCVRQESYNSPASACRKLQWSKTYCTDCSMPSFKYSSMYKKKRFSSKSLGCRSLTKVLSGKFRRPMFPKVQDEKKFKMCLDQLTSEKWELKHTSHKLNSQLNGMPARMVHAAKSLLNTKLFGKVLQEKLEDCKSKKERSAHSTFLHRNTLLKKQKNFKVHSPKLTWDNINTFVPVVYPLTTCHPHAPRALKAFGFFSGKPLPVFPGNEAQDKLKSCDGWKVMTCGTQEKSSGTTYQSGISGREMNRSDGRHSSNKSYSLNSGSNRGDGDGGEDEDNPDDDNTSCQSKFYGKCPLCGLKLKSIKIAKRHLATHVSKPVNTDTFSSSSKKHGKTLSTEAKQNIPPDLLLSSMKSTQANTNLYESVKIPTGCGTTEIIAVKPTLPVVRKHVIRPSKYYKSPADTTQDFKIKKNFQSGHGKKGKDSVINKPLCLISEVRSLQPEISETSPNDGTKKLPSHHVEVKTENVKNIQRKSGRAGVKKKDLKHQGVGSCSTDILPRQDIQCNYSTHSQTDNPTYPSLILATTVKSEPVDFTSDVSSAPETNVTSHVGDLQGNCTVDQQSKNLTSLALFPAVKAEPVELSEVSWSCASGLNKHSAEKNTNILANQVSGLQTNVSLLGHEFDEKPIDIEVKAEPLTESDEEEDLLTVTFDDNCLPLRQLDALGGVPPLENPVGEKSCENFPYTVASMTHVHNDSQNSLYTVPGFSRKGLRSRSGSKLAKDKSKDISGALELTSVEQNKHYKVDDLSDDELLRLGIPLVYVHPTKPVVNLGFPRATRSTRICTTEEANLLQQVTSAARSRAEDSTADELSSITKSAASAGSSDVKSEVENRGNQVDCVDNIKSSYIASLVGESSCVENTTKKSPSAEKFDKKSSSADKSTKKSSHPDSDNVKKIKPSRNVPSSTKSDCTQNDKNLDRFSANQRKTNPSIVYVHPKKPVINYLGRVQRNDKCERQVQKRSKPYKKVRVGKVTYQML